VKINNVSLLFNFKNQNPCAAFLFILILCRIWRALSALILKHVVTWPEVNADVTLASTNLPGGNSLAIARFEILPFATAQQGA
jgi:hypothetical protein